MDRRCPENFSEKEDDYVLDMACLHRRATVHVFPVRKPFLTLCDSVPLASSLMRVLRC